jgi:hypothetical protein
LCIKVVSRGVATSPEDVVTVALRSMDEALEPDLETRLGMSVDEINRELDKGLSGPATRWEGAKSFHERMLAKHQDALSGRPQK